MRYASKEFLSNPGNPIKTVFAPAPGENGTIRLKATGKRNTDEEIQSHLESTDMRFILSRLGAGDVSVLQARKPMYGDFTGTPSTLADVYALYNNMHSKFEALPDEVKDKFGNSFEEFCQTAGSQDWFQKVTIPSQETLVNSGKEGE